MDGWIKLHRKLLEKAIWLQSTPEHGVILITLLMIANQKEQQWMWQGKKFECQPGQFITSAASIIKKCPKGITRQNIRSALEKFKNSEFLTYETTKTGMLITITNWQVYQSKKPRVNQQTNQEVTKNQPTGNQEVTTNKKERKKESKKVITPPIVPPVKNNYSEFVTMTEVEYQKLLEKFGEQATSEMIELLNNYKGSKGVKYKSDYLTILGWPQKRWKEEHLGREPKKTSYSKGMAGLMQIIQEGEGLQ